MSSATEKTLREKLIEAGADAMTALPYDTIELRYWGDESVPDPARVLSEAALDALLDCLAENADEWVLTQGYRNDLLRDHVRDLIVVLGGTR